MRDPLEREANRRGPGLLSELVAYMAAHKKWWLLPILITMLLLGALMLLGGTSVAPFLYPLF